MKITITKRNGNDVPEEVIVNEKQIELGDYKIGEDTNLGELSGERITIGAFKDRYPLNELVGTDTPEADSFDSSEYQEQRVRLKAKNAFILILNEVLSNLSDDDEVKFD